MTPPSVEVILCNFGGPTQSDEVYPFLLRLFEDPFIIRRKMPEVLRRFIARKIAGKRAPHSDREYAKIGYSPINKCTLIQAAALEKLLKTINSNTRVHVINRYTRPHAHEVIPLIDPQKSRVFIVTMYPHLCHSTTVSSLRDIDQAFEQHFGHRDFPSTRVFSWWHHPRYLALSFEYLRQGIEVELKKSVNLELDILFSAHGIPAPYDLRGDPYVTETKGHYEELKRRIFSWLEQSEFKGQKERVHFHLSFQSRVGPVEWVRPYTDETIVRLAKMQSGKHLLMVPISFTSDHIETLFEMDQTYRDLALQQGFAHYSRVKPPGEDLRLAECLRDVLVMHGFGADAQ